ncbi:MAG TPA: prepilin-type N-terminal cleavage/methylation domain-containing protein [Opitutaceae bacterium]|nr:prepilin-type N-terminal cleavage/methylation domain-containing protein [Opitutaceae bacterium]
MRARRGGFTLLEILVSLALVGMIFVALNTFIFSMGELWGRNTDVRLFDQHVNAVTRFLSQTLETASLPPSAQAGSAPVYPEQVTPQGGAADNLLTFDLPAGLRLLNWPDHPLPEVTCSLQARPNDGLYLLWHSRLEMHYADDPPREVKLTPFCTGFGYDYYDDNFKRWTTENALQNDSNGQPTPPQRLRLYFQYGKLKRETVVTVPKAVQGAPNFE